MPRSNPRALLTAFHEAAVQGAAPFARTRDALHRWWAAQSLPPAHDAPVYLIALGKAAPAMAAGAFACYNLVLRVPGIPFLVAVLLSGLIAAVVGIIFGLPSLRINDFYKDMIGKNGVDPKARAFLRDQIRDGRSLIRSISLRQETILAIAHKLIEQQTTFLEKGPRHLRPLTMNDIADELELHATTVSRAVAGKYILTPQGLMEMRAFFATGYQTEGGAEVSNAGVREAIQQLISQENPAKPLSDDAITKALQKQGIKVARRTIAKYREQLNILPSHLRKSF
jgi:hypothetical protein